MPRQDKIQPLAALQALRDELRAAGKRVVQCHGCFDIVHPGHIRYLQFARAQGDALIVSVSSDAVVGKGAERPYITEELRLENLAALEVVDYVCLDDNTWAGPVLEALRPDVYVKGREYETSSDPRFAREKALVEGYGGQVVFSSGEVVYSSTAIIDSFRDRFVLDDQKVAAFCRRNAIDAGAIRRRLADIHGARLLVLGDPILDHYITCDALGLAADSPVPSVAPVDEAWFVGAAGLIARQASTLGAHAAFMTLLGEDPHSERLSEALQRDGVEVIAVPVPDRPPAVKTRYLVEDKKVLKVDRARYSPLSTRTTAAVIAALDARLPTFDGLVVTDFGYGLFGAELCAAVSALAATHQKPVFADVSSSGRANILRFRAPAVATPTEQELRFAFGDQESGLSNLASRYYRETDAGRLVLTLGKRGVLLFGHPSDSAPRLRTDYLPALGRRAVDTVGSGDVFLGALAAAHLAGAPLAEAAYLGAAVAALHVGRLGNDAVALFDVERFLAHRPELG